MNNCALWIPSLPAALGTTSAIPHPSGQAASKYAGADGFNLTVILPCEASQQLILIACLAASTTTLECFIRLCPFNFAQIVV